MGDGWRHVVGNFLQHALLRRGGMEGQDAFQRRAHAVARSRRRCPACARSLRRFSSSPSSRKNSSSKISADVRRGARRLQRGKALAGIGPVRLPEGLGARNQPDAPANRRRNGVGKICGRIVLQRGVDDAAEPARGQPSLPALRRWARCARLPASATCARASPSSPASSASASCRISNCGCSICRPPRPRVLVLDLAVERHQLPGWKLSFEVAAAEPQAFQGVAALARGHLQDGHAPGAKQAGGAHLGDDAGHLARAELGDAARIDPVFIAKRQVVEQVFNGGDALVQQHLGQVRPYALDELNVGGEFEHIAMVNERGGS